MGSSYSGSSQWQWAVAKSQSHSPFEHDSGQRGGGQWELVCVSTHSQGSGGQGNVRQGNKGATGGGGWGGGVGEADINV